jgi:hypothetical protein
VFVAVYVRVIEGVNDIVALFEAVGVVVLVAVSERVMVRVTVRVSGPETPERYAELREAVDVHCPVLDLFGNATPVSTRLEPEPPA